METGGVGCCLGLGEAAFGLRTLKSSGDPALFSTTTESDEAASCLTLLLDKSKAWFEESCICLFLEFSDTTGLGLSDLAAVV